MEAGLATLRALTPDVFHRMNAMGADVRSRLSAAFTSLSLQVTLGSLFKVSASHEPISDYRSAVTSAVKKEEGLAAPTRVPLLFPGGRDKSVGLRK